MPYRPLWILIGLLGCGCSASPESRAARNGGVPTHAIVDPAAARSESGEREASAPPELITLEVGGMTCSGCVARIQHSLSAVPGVHRVDVNLDTQKAVVLADSGVADTALTGAVRRAGSEFLGLIQSR